MQKRITFGEVEETLRKDLQIFPEKEREEVRQVLGKVGLTPSEIVKKYKNGEISPFLPWFLQVYDKGVIYKESIPIYLSITNSEAVIGSANIKNSKKIYRSLGVEDSFDIRYSKEVFNSRYIESSNYIFNSENCRESTSINDSYNIVCSNSIINSQYLIFCYRLINCRCCALCSDLTNGLFCFNFTPEVKSSEKYYMFNVEVSKEEFESALLCFERMKDLYEAYVEEKIANTIEFLEWYDSLPNSNRMFLKLIINIDKISRSNNITDNKNFFNILFSKAKT